MPARRKPDLARTAGVVLSVWPGAKKRVEEERAAVVCITRCGLCPQDPGLGWWVDATVVEGAALLRAHIAAAHPDVERPEPRPRRGRRRADTTRD